jgi:hypothetical protein
MAKHWILKNLNTPQKLQYPSFWNGLNYGIKKYSAEMDLNDMTFLLNFVKNLPYFIDTGNMYFYSLLLRIRETEFKSRALQFIILSFDAI